MAQSPLGVILGLLLIQGLGLYLFIDGFLLTRTVVDEKSSCAPPGRHDSTNSSSNTPHVHSDEERCRWAEPQVRRAVILVIDALRHDFIFYNDTADELSRKHEAQLPYYVNKLPVLHDLVTNNDGTYFAQLYKFIADAPTTTMQRIKGLTTGSLPTFIDAGSNFASSAISEDNWIGQLKRAGMKVVVMGDDTWGSLYPDELHRSYLYDSFNVRDLYTVDNGVHEHLLPEIAKPDWDVIIAHYLGVDHCGHTFGPSHPKMAEKLEEMDGAIRSVVDVLGPDTVLIVLGDHGMTDSGDHGGDSEREVEAGLFMYAKGLGHVDPIDHWDTWLRLSDDDQEPVRSRSVNQIDLVPTLSLLLGIPIPFGNLGAAIPELFFRMDSSSQAETDPMRDIAGRFAALNRMLRLNALQVREYLRTYEQTSPELPHGQLSAMDARLAAAIEKHARLEESASSAADLSAAKAQRDVYRAYVGYLESVRRMCICAWARFDLLSIGLGMGLLALSCACMVLTFSAGIEEPLGATRLALWLLGGVAAGSIAAQSAGSTLGLSDPDRRHCALFAGGASVVLAYVLHAAGSGYTPAAAKRGLASHSPAAFGAAGVLVHCAAFFSNSFVVWEDAIVRFLIATLLLGQTWLYLCEARGRAAILAVAAMALTRISSATYVCREEQLGRGCVQPEDPLPFGLVCALPCLAVTVAQRLFQGHVHGRYTRLHLTYVLPVSIASVCLYWTVIYASDNHLSSLPAWQQVIFPQLMYGTILLGFGAWGLDAANRRRGSNVAADAHKNPLGKAQVDEALTSYGYFCLLWWVLLCGITLMDFSLGFVTSAGLLACFIGMYGAGVSGSGKADTLAIDFNMVVLMSLAASNGFFATGHQAAFPTIQWVAAFVGFSNMYFYAALVLVALNTVSTTVLFTLALPAMSRPAPGEANTHSSSKLLRWSVLLLIVKTVVLLSAAAAATLHRRHLMVWKIFAPRFLYEAVFVAAADASIIVANAAYRFSQ